MLWNSRSPSKTRMKVQWGLIRGGDCLVFIPSWVHVRRLPVSGNYSLADSERPVRRWYILWPLLERSHHRVHVFIWCVPNRRCRHSDVQVSITWCGARVVHGLHVGLKMPHKWNWICGGLDVRTLSSSVVDSEAVQLWQRYSVELGHPSWPSWKMPSDLGLTTAHGH